MLNQISLVWRRYAGSPILSVDARGLTREELRHYAQQVGFIAFQGGCGEPALVGNRARREDLLCLLESAGYEIEEVTASVLPAPVISLGGVVLGVFGIAGLLFLESSIVSSAARRRRSEESDAGIGRIQK